MNMENNKALVTALATSFGATLKEVLGSSTD